MNSWSNSVDLVSIRSVSKNFDSRPVVQQLNLSVSYLQRMALLGLNDAGKSTILRIVAGLLRPSEGSVLIEGQDLYGTSAHIVRTRLGYLPQQLVFPEKIVVGEFLRTVARIRGHRAKSAHIRNVLEQTLLMGVVDTPIYKLSRCTKQRLGLAQAIVHEPSILLLDEPSTGLDPKQKKEMWDLIRCLGRSITILLSTQDLDEVSQCCDQVVFLQAGRLLKQTTIQYLRHATMCNPELLFVITGTKNKLDEMFQYTLSEGIIDFFKYGLSIDSHIHEVRIGTKKPPEDIARLLFSAGFAIRHITEKTLSLEEILCNMAKS